jgi:O-antigen/teichoic acid export membrane protein
MYTSLLIVPLIAVSFTMMGIRRSAVFHLGQNIFNANRIVSGVMQLLLLTSILAMIISAVGFLFFKPEGVNIYMIMISILTIPVKLTLIYSGGIFLGKQQFQRSNLTNWLPLLFNLAGVMIFVILLRMTVLGALLALFISNLAVAGISIRKLANEHSISFRPDKKVIGSLVNLGVIYAVAVMVMQLNYRVDILFLQKLSTIQQVGYYSLGVAISEQLWQLPTAIGIVVLSRTANSADEAVLNADVARLVRLSFLAILLLGTALYFLIPFLLPFIYGGRFIPSVSVVRAMLPGIIFFVIPRILNSRFAGVGKPQLLLWVFVPALLVNAALNFWLVPLYGGIGAAWASNVSYIGGAISLIVLFSVKMNFPLNEILIFRSSDFAVFTKYLPKRS